LVTAIAILTFATPAKAWDYELDAWLLQREIKEQTEAIERQTKAMENAERRAEEREYKARFEESLRQLRDN
jgi:hypothetical protein